MMDKDAMFWDHTASRYDGIVSKRFRRPYTEIKRILLREIHSDDEVLDIGCGTGLLTRTAAERASMVVGLDGSPRMIGQANRGRGDRGNLEYSIGSAYHLPFPDMRFEKCIMGNILHVLNDPKGALSEACRVLRNEGCLLVFDECAAEATMGEKLALLRDLISIWVSSRRITFPTYNLLTRLELEELVRHDDLTISESAIIDQSHGLVYFKLLKGVTR